MIDPGGGSRKMGGIVRVTIGVVAIALVAMPIAFVTTIALTPLWSYIERRWSIESIGHSGPADWCFWLVYAVCVAMGLGAMIAMRRTRPVRD